jgi:hypothetical protein
MEKDKIIEKVKKCLALGESGNPFEAEQALKRAHEMCAKYGIDIASEEINVETEFVQASFIANRKRKHPAFDFVSMIIQKYFSCNIVYNYREGQLRLIFIGNKKQVEIARHVYIFLFREFTNRWSAYKQLKNNKGTQVSYYRGLYEGVKKTLESNEAEYNKRFHKFALIQIDQKQKRDEYQKKVIQNLKQTPVRFDVHDIDAYHDGVEQGTNIQLRKALR